MQISLNWIDELIDLETIQLKKLIEKLTLGGFEVEEVLEFDIDTQKYLVLDISATANRSDSLSMQGISTEIATLLNKQKKVSKYRNQNGDWKKKIQDKIEFNSNNSNCSLFLSVIIENLETIIIPKWITRKLRSSGITPCNNILDFQNYILLETGYPFEFYDFEKICSKLKTPQFNLSITPIKNKLNFLASNDSEYELSNSILTVNANQIPISIAGIIQSKTFLVSESTTKFLIEGSVFDGAKIRQQSKFLGLRTDRSARYEKSLRNTYLLESFYRLISILRISNPNLICKLHTIQQTREKILKPILLDHKNITKILGKLTKIQSTTSELNEPISIMKNVDLDTTNDHFEKLITNYLERLQFKFTSKTPLSWLVTIPHIRADDITREIDLIEEIGRLHGFDNFSSTLPKIKTIGNEDSSYKIRKKITACLLNLGFSELIHYSLVNQKTFLKNEIKLLNPLLTDCSNLRLSLLPTLIKTVHENEKQKNIVIEGFEYGHVFSFDALEKLKEKEYVAGIFGGIKTNLSWSDSKKSLTWFEAKGKIDQLFHQLNFSTYWQKCLNTKMEQIVHPYRSADIFLKNGLNLGIFGQINPILANQLNLSPEIYLFEFDIEILKSQFQTNKLRIYKSYSLYPKIIKDLSFIIQKDIQFGTIQKTLYCNGSKFLSEINLLDEYKGQFIANHQTSLCLQLVFQSNQKTLESKEIENIIEKLKLILIQKFNVIIRD